MATVSIPRRVAVVDDDEVSRDTLVAELREAGFEPVKPQRSHYPTPRVLVEELVRSCGGAVCDHRLQDGNLANFYGAELVAALYDTGFPAILMTEWARTDSYGPIRRHRRKIPVLLPTSNSSSVAIEKAFAVCERELSGYAAPDRIPWRTAVVVEGTVDINGQQIVEAFVPAWDPHEPIQFPMDLFPTTLRHQVKREAQFLARVNIGADQQEDLFLEDFEIAPDPYEALKDV